MMGMFDSFYCTIKCPYCGNIAEIEFQTKALMNALAVWHEGKKFDGGHIYIREGMIKNCLGGCNSKKCTAFQIKRDGYRSGFGRSFYADIRISKGKVAGANVRKK